MLYRSGLSKESGTFLQLKNIINHHNIGSNISGRVSEVGDFVELVVKFHLLAATLVCSQCLILLVPIALMYRSVREV